MVLIVSAFIYLFCWEEGEGRERTQKNTKVFSIGGRKICRKVD